MASTVSKDQLRVFKSFHSNPNALKTPELIRLNKEAANRKEKQDRNEIERQKERNKTIQAIKEEKAIRNAASHAIYLAAEEERKKMQALQKQKPNLPTASQQFASGVVGKIAEAGRAARNAISGVNTTKYNKYYNNSEPNGVNHFVAAEAEKAEAEKASAETKDTVFFTLEKITYACHIRKGNNRAEGEILVEKGESYLVQIEESQAA